MRFEVMLPHRLACWALRSAGVDSTAYLDCSTAVINEHAPLPFEVSSFYFLSENPLEVRITRLRNATCAHLSVEVQDEETGRNIQSSLARYSVENNGAAIDEREHKLLWDKIEQVLARDGASYEKLQRGEAVLSRRGLESLMQLCDETERNRKQNIHSLFTAQRIPAPDRLFVVRWLLKAFEAERDPHEQIGVRIWELAVRQVADDLIRLITDIRFGERRGMLCLALAKTKDARAGDVIASVLEEKGLTRYALEALGKLRAAKHSTAVRKFLQHPDPDIRREAKKALKSLGFPVEAAPPPIHIVKNRRLLPQGLEEWSQNLDAEQLNSVLEKLALCIEQGFGPKEVAEVVGVVASMKPKQTKAFRFYVAAHGQESELWLVIFMDDVDSPDLEVHTHSAIIEKFSAEM